jgi:chromosome partitioning protein
MTKTIAFVSLKGGVGKTTCALNSAFAFARSGIRTLLIDADPQGAVASSVDGVGEDVGLAAAVADASAPLQVIETRLPDLHLLPAGRVDSFETDTFAAQAREQHVLERCLAHARDRYDLVVFDTPAGLGGMTRLVLESVEHVVAVVQCEPLALRALPRLMELLARLRQNGSTCSLTGVLSSMSTFRDSVVLASLEELWALYKERVFDTSIPRDPAFLRASRSGVPLGLLSRRPPAVAAVFDSLAAEIDARIGIVEGEGDEEPIRLVDRA